MNMSGFKILVVGGAGYIGSHMVKFLLGQGNEVTVLDNLSSGYLDSVLGGCFVFGDLNDEKLLNSLFQSSNFDVVMHFASCIDVAESMRDPHKYYMNNAVNSLNLLDVMLRHNVCLLYTSPSPRD